MRAWHTIKSGIPYAGANPICRYSCITIEVAECTFNVCRWLVMVHECIDSSYRPTIIFAISIFLRYVFFFHIITCARGPHHSFLPSRWIVSNRFAPPPFSHTLCCSHLSIPDLTSVCPFTLMLVFLVFYHWLRFSFLSLSISPRLYSECVLHLAACSQLPFNCFFSIPTYSRNSTTHLLSSFFTLHILRNQLFSDTGSFSSRLPVDADVPNPCTVGTTRSFNNQWAAVLFHVQILAPIAQQATARPGRHAMCTVKCQGHTKMKLPFRSFTWITLIMQDSPSYSM